MLILPYTLVQQMQAFIEHKSMCRTAVSLGHDPPQMPCHDDIGDAAILMKHVSIGKKALKGTEEESVELRKMLYGGNALFGSYDIWNTLSPNDETDPIVAAHAGYKYEPRTSANGTPAARQDDHRTAVLTGNDQPNPTQTTSLKGYSQGDMADAVANNPVACARGFRRQVEIYVKHIVGWDLETGMSNEGVMSLVQAFSIQVEEQFRQNLHAHGIYSLAAAPSTLKAFVDKLNRTGGISVERVINFANDIQCNSVMSDPVFYDKSMVCENAACPAVVAPPPVAADTVMDPTAVLATSPGLASDNEAPVVPLAPRSLISEPIDESILNTTKPLGYHYQSPPTVACDVCYTKYVGHEVLERAVLVELQKHGGIFADLGEAWGRSNDAFNVRMEAMSIEILDMETLRKPEYQAVLTLLVLQFNRHRAGHHRSCFKLKIKGTCRFGLPHGTHLLTTLIINNMEFDKFGNVMYLDNRSTVDGAVATHDDDVPLAAIVVDASTPPVPLSAFPLIQALKLEDITTMDIAVQRKIGSEYINRYNPIVMITFGWNNDMTTMLTSPGIIHYITNYVSKGPDAGATGAAMIRAFKQTVEKRQREDLQRLREAATITDASANDTSNPFRMDSPLVDATPSNQQRSKCRVIATMLAVDRTQEIGQNLVAYTALYNTTHMHSHQFKSVQVPQMLAYLRGDPINGVVSRVSPLDLPPTRLSANTTASTAEAAGVLLYGDDSDDDAEYADGYEEGLIDASDQDPASASSSTPVKLAAVPQVLKETHKK